MLQTLSIIIPTYNEEQTIVALLEKVKAVQLIRQMEKEIIVVNDFSTDRTKALVKQFMLKNPDLKLKFFAQTHNMGKGAAIHRGIELATGDYVVIQDADLEYDPEEYNALLRPLVRGFADVVYGSRFTGANPHRILFFWHSIGNKFLTFLSNAFTNLNLTDMETCYKMFRTPLLKSLNLKEKRFGFEPEVTAKVSRIQEVRIYEIGISYYGRTYGEGKKINWRDGFWAIYCIIKYNLFK